MKVKRIKYYLLINVLLLLNLSGVSQNWANISTAGPDWVNCGDINVTGNQVTVEALITWTGGSVDIVSKHTGPPNVNYLLRPGEFQLTTSNGYIALINPLPIAFNTTYHVAGVYDGSFLYYYVNGCLTAQVAWSGNLVQNTFLTAIGNQSNCQCEQFDGYINEVRIWNVARTQVQIQANMNTLPSPTTQAGLLAYYSFSSGYTNLQGNATYNATPIGTISLVTNPFYVAPTVFSATATDVDLICNGVNNGSITANATGGNTPYTFSLSTGTSQASNTFNNLSAGNYTVIAISADGSCMEQMPIIVTTPPAITLTTSQNNVTCYGLSNGSATTTVSGGTGPTYTVGIVNPLQGGITTGLETFSGLAVGTYTIGAQDGEGCQEATSITITQPPYTYISVVSPNPNCDTSNLDWVTWSSVNATSGVGTISSSLNLTLTKPTGGLSTSPQMFNGSFFPTQYNVPINSTSVKNTLAGVFTFCFNHPVINPQVAFSSIGNPGLTVPITTSVPYTVIWTGINMTYPNDTTLSGTEGYTIIEFPGQHTCISFDYLQSENYCNIAFGIRDTNCQTTPICNGATATFTTTGAVNYTWSPSTGLTQITGSVISASPSSNQTYTIIGTDAFGCNDTATTTVIVNSVPIATVNSFTNVSCFGGNNGSALLDVTNGTTPYTYLWTNGNTSIKDSLLLQGIYSVTATDANSCIATTTVTITQPPVLTLTATTTNVSCNGLSTGSATAVATGGVGPYLVGVNTVPPQGGPTVTGIEPLSGLPAGTYTFGVQDANSCQAVFVGTITQPTLLTSTTTQTNVTCFGLATGSATVTPAGGTTPYASYSWSPSGGTATIANGLSAQNYTVTVTDFNSCTTTSTLTITQPNPFIASISSQTNVSCFGLSDGSATGTQTGGTAPYTYNWTPIGGTTTTANNLPAQVYTMTVSDANLCPATATVNITQPPLLTITTATTEVTCNGLSTGCTTITPVGGTPTYTLGINSIPPQGPFICGGGGSQPLCGLSAGSYTIGVQDAQGCPAITTITITQPPALTLTATQTNVTCNGLSNGSATATATGGTGPYTIGINSTPPQGGITATGIEPVSGLPAGAYTFGVQDANGCPLTTTLTITQPAVLTTSILISHNDSCNGDHNGTATATSTGGTTPYSYSWNTTPAQPDSTASNLSVGNYTATVTDVHGCTATTFTTITQPPVLTVSSNSVTICISNTTTLTAMAVGGNTTLPYTYSIAGTLGNTAVVSPIATTIYTLGVIDMKGCIATNSVVVVVRDSLNSTVNPGAAICNGVSTGLNATGSGGDNTYTYTWLPGSLVGQFVTVQPTLTTTYTLVLTDACGTPSVTSVVTITVNPLPNVTVTATPVSGCYPLPVLFTSTPQQQTPMPVITNYAWNLGGGYTSTIANPSQVYANPGVYDIIVSTTSDEGCVSTYSVANYITVYNHPVADFTYQPDPANILAPTIQFTDISTAPGSYIKNVFWQTFGDGSDSTSITHNPVHIYQDTGTYCVNLIATNGLGCKDTTQQCVVIKPYFTLYVPNAFSPNGDGINDMFYAIGEYVSSFDMKIFDRWGSVIYHSGSILSGWNGSKGGAVAEEGVYVYLINATDALRKTHSYKGTVTLIK